MVNLLNNDCLFKTGDLVKVKPASMQLKTFFDQPIGYDYSKPVSGLIVSASSYLCKEDSHFNSVKNEKYTVYYVMINLNIYEMFEFDMERLA